ncbi:MAG: TetR/AcrR family transcriptional regulator [Acidobacteriota bacterium]
MKANARRAQHREELRAQILDAARGIFVESGYERFSMRKLASSVGYSAAAIYLHFESKQELFDVLIEESFAHLHEELGVLIQKRGKDPVQQLKRGLRVYVEWGLRHPAEYAIAFIVRNPFKRPYKTHRAFDVARSLVKLCLVGSRAGEREVESSTQALWAATHGITSLLIQRPSFPWISRDRLIDDVIDAAVIGAIRRGRKLEIRGLRAKQS